MNPCVIKSDNVNCRQVLPLLNKDEIEMWKQKLRESLQSNVRKILCFYYLHEKLGEYGWEDFADMFSKSFFVSNILKLA